MAKHIFKGLGPPTFAPRQVGHHYVDTLNDKNYLSVGTATFLDWQLVVPNLIQINGLAVVPSLILSTGSSGLAPNWTNNGLDTHYINIPLASGPGVTSGTISNATYQSFDARQYAPQNVLRVIKNATLGLQDYNTLVDALNAVSGNSATNRWCIFIAPGVYTENNSIAPITLKPFVTIKSLDNRVATIQPQDPTKDLFLINSSSVILEGVNLQNVTGAGTAAIRVTSSPQPSILDYIGFTNCTEHLVLESNATPVQVTLFNGRFISGAATRKFIRIQSNSGQATSLRLYGAFCTEDNGTLFADGVYLTGAGSRIDSNNLLLRSTTGVGNGIHVRDGGEFVSQTGSEIEAFDKNLWVENAGTFPLIRTTTVMFRQGVTADIQIDHPGTRGSLIAKANTQSLVFVDPAVPLKLFLTDPTMDSTGIFVKGDILQADRFDRRANLSLLARKTSTLGAIEDVATGFISVVSGLQINVIAGMGFLNDPTDLYLKQVTWPSTNITLGANTTNYVYVDTNSTVQVSPSPTSLETTVVLGRVVTNGTGVRFIENSDFPLNHVSNKVEVFLRKGLGPVFGTGCLITENATPRKLDNTAGSYFYGVYPLDVSSGVAFSWESFYQDGVGGFTSIPVESTISNSLYDDGSGTLAAIPAGQFAKHTLYVIGDTGFQKWFVEYSQATYLTLAAAEDAPIPSVPSYINDAVVRIASIIVQQGQVNIQQILDIRPRIGFAAPSGTAVTDHGMLTGLLDDDHPQYLLIDGSRAMTGPLNMGGNLISNVSTVNGVVVEAHASRHLPNGLDPLATAAPIASLSATTTNSVGIANTLSRSDHGHAILTGTPVTLLPDQANAPGTSANLVREDHVHNVPTAIAVDITDSTNSQGVSASFSRADHQHAHGNRGGGPLHALVTTLVAGFMSAPDKVKLDGIATGATNTPLSAVPPVNVNKSTALVGISTSAARSDHKHDIDTAAAVTISTSNTEGVSSSLARADHTHQLFAIANNTMLANISGSAAAPVSTTLTSLLDSTLSNVQGSVIYRDGSVWTTLSPGTSGQVLTTGGPSANPTWTTNGAGTVSSVAITVPSFLNVSGSPITSSGTFAVTLATELANSVFAGPTSGGAATPTFRSLVAADIPALAYVTSVALASPAEFTVSGSPVTSSGTLTLTKATQSANTHWSGPVSGGAAQPTFRALVTADMPAGTGTVTSVATGTGLTGGIITTTGTISLATVANLTLLSNISGGVAAPTPNTLSAIFDATLSSTQGTVIYRNATNWVTLAPGTNGQVLTTGGAAANPTWTTNGAGTVTSVALALPSIFAISGSPVTTSGTLTGTFNTQTANTIFAGPSSGGAATPTFRTQVLADLPQLTNGQLYIGSTGAAVVAAILTAGTGISITNAAGSITVAASQLTRKYDFLASELDSANNANWAVNNNAPASSDTVNNALTVRRFDDATEEGAGFTVMVPTGTTNIVFGFKGRAQTAPGGAVNAIMRLYNRQIPDNAAVTAWSAALTLTTLAVPTNTNFQYYTQTISLATLGITANRLVQFELTRNGASGSDTLTGDFDLLQVIVEFT